MHQIDLSMKILNNLIHHFNKRLVLVNDNLIYRRTVSHLSQVLTKRCFIKRSSKITLIRSPFIFKKT
jgi:hypothetical protein